MGVSWLEYSVYKLVDVGSNRCTKQQFVAGFLGYCCQWTGRGFQRAQLRQNLLFLPLRLTNHMVEKSEGSKTTSWCQRFWGISVFDVFWICLVHATCSELKLHNIYIYIHIQYQGVRSELLTYWESRSHDASFTVCLWIWENHQMVVGVVQPDNTPAQSHNFSQQS